MSEIITRGFGYASVVCRDISSQLVGFVVAEARISGTVRTVQNIIGYLVEEGLPMSDDGNQVTMYLRNDRTLSVVANYEDGGGPADLTGARIWFTAKKKASDTDALAVISKKNAAAGGSDAEILITNPIGGAAQIFITPDDTDALVPGSYVYDVQVRLANSKTYTIVRDHIILKEDVTKART